MVPVELPVNATTVDTVPADAVAVAPELPAVMPDQKPLPSDPLPQVDVVNASEPSNPVTGGIAATDPVVPVLETAPLTQVQSGDDDEGPVVAEPPVTGQTQPAEILPVDPMPGEPLPVDPLPVSPVLPNPGVPADVVPVTDPTVDFPTTPMDSLTVEGSAQPQELPTSMLVVDPLAQQYPIIPVIPSDQTTPMDPTVPVYPQMGASGQLTGFVDPGFGQGTGNPADQYAQVAGVTNPADIQVDPFGQPMGPVNPMLPVPTETVVQPVDPSTIVTNPGVPMLPVEPQTLPTGIPDVGFAGFPQSWQQGPDTFPQAWEQGQSTLPQPLEQGPNTLPQPLEQGPNTSGSTIPPIASIAAQQDPAPEDDD